MEKARSQLMAREQNESNEMFWMRQQMPRSYSVDVPTIPLIKTGSSNQFRVRSSSMSTHRMSPNQFQFQQLQQPIKQMHHSIVHQQHPSNVFQPSCSSSGMNQWEQECNGMMLMMMPKHVINDDDDVSDVDVNVIPMDSDSVLVPLIRVSGCSSSEKESFMEN